MVINRDYMIPNFTGYKPVILGIVIHNTAGGSTAIYHAQRVKAMTAEQLEKGFANYWVDNNSIYQSYEDDLITWHTANTEGNYKYIGIEVVDGMDEQGFIQAEQLAFDLAAELCKKHNLPLNSIRLHSEFTNTACPARSKSLHGTVQQTKQYFNDQVNARINGVVPPQPNPTPNPVPPQNEYWVNEIDESGRYKFDLSVQVYATLDDCLASKHIRVEKVGAIINYTKIHNSNLYNYMYANGEYYVFGKKGVEPKFGHNIEESGEYWVNHEVVSGTHYVDRDIQIYDSLDNCLNSVASGEEYKAGQSYYYIEKHTSNLYVYLGYYSHKGYMRYVVAGKADGTKYGTF